MPQEARAGTKDRCPFPRVAFLPLPEDITFEKYSSYNQQRRCESGYYRGRNYSQKSQVSPRLLRLMEPLRNERGMYICPFCRSYDARDVYTGWQDVKFRSSTLYTDVTSIDSHVLAYHLPFIRYYSCPCDDGYACLTSQSLRSHLREPTDRHRQLLGYPDPENDSFDNEVRLFISRFVDTKDCPIRANPFFRVPHIPMNIEIRLGTDKPAKKISIGPWIFVKKIFLQRKGLQYSTLWHVVDSLTSAPDPDDDFRVSWERTTSDYIPQVTFTKIGIVIKCDFDSTFERWGNKQQKDEQVSKVVVAVPPRGHYSKVVQEHKPDESTNPSEDMMDISIQEDAPSSTCNVTTSTSTSITESVPVSAAMSFATAVVASTHTNKSTTETVCVRPKTTTGSQSRQISIVTTAVPPVAVPTTLVKQKNTVAETLAGNSGIRSPLVQPLPRLPLQSTPRMPTLRPEPDVSFANVSRMPALEAESPPTTPKQSGFANTPPRKIDNLKSFPNDLRFLVREDRQFGSTAFYQPSIRLPITEEMRDVAMGYPPSRNRLQDRAFLSGPFQQYLEFENKSNIGSLDEQFCACDDDELEQDDLIAKHQDILDEVAKISDKTNSMSAFDEEDPDLDNAYVIHSRNCERVRRIHEQSVEAMLDIYEEKQKFIFRATQFRAGATCYAMGQAHARQEIATTPFTCGTCEEHKTSNKRLREVLVDKEFTIRQLIQERNQVLLELDTLKNEYKDSKEREDSLSLQIDHLTLSKEEALSDMHTLSVEMAALRDETIVEVDKTELEETIKSLKEENDDLRKQNGELQDDVTKSPSLKSTQRLLLESQKIYDSIIRVPRELRMDYNIEYHEMDKAIHELQKEISAEPPKRLDTEPTSPKRQRVTPDEDEESVEL